MSDRHPAASPEHAARDCNARRDLLLGVAYRVFGRVADAEDVVPGLVQTIHLVANPEKLGGLGVT